MRVEREDKFISCILHRQFLLSLAYFYFRLSVFTHYHCQRLTKQLIIQCQTRCYLEGRLFLSNIQLYIFSLFHISCYFSIGTNPDIVFQSFHPLKVFPQYLRRGKSIISRCNAMNHCHSPFTCDSKFLHPFI